YIVQIEGIPLTGNGKVDRKRLLEKEITDQDQIIKKAIKQARTETEKKLVEIWRNVLDVEDISIDANFFELGGNSINLSQLYSKMQNDYKDLNIADLFKYQSIEEISQYLNSQTNSVSNLPLDSIEVPQKILNNEDNYESKKIIVLEKKLNLVLNKETESNIVNTFLYLLSSFVEKEEYFISNLQNKNFIMFEKVVTKSYQSLEELRKFIKSNSIKKSFHSKFQYTKKINLKNNSSSINVIIINGDYLENIQHNLSKYYDFIFEYTHSTDKKIHFSITYSNDKLKNESMELFFKTFIDVISKLN
ncbi:phosphopantetheine-binding protein, partial [Bacillus atrophaeus]|uniref:phosphopantetheine-binding protein n=3 Tax=Bacillus atrophaeus TaxID=1452 RepID=UPI000B0A1FA9